MKKYDNSWSCSGHSLMGRIQHCQKVGVAGGIAEMLKNEAWKRRNAAYVFSPRMRITVIIPTKKDDYIFNNCPVFECQGKYGVIDMLMFDRMLRFHIMWIKGELGSFKNGGWHSVDDDSLTLEQTCTLFEYVDDVRENMIILSKGDETKYIKTGALGVGV